jgi:hypothetical protein
MSGESTECDSCAMEVRVSSCVVLRGDLVCSECAACMLAGALRRALAPGEWGAASAR